MKRYIAAILLVLSLAGRLSAAVADGKVDTIRLPSHGLANELATAAREIGAEKKRPWKCCDKKICLRTHREQVCSCLDQVDQCDEACTKCEPVFGDPSKHICLTAYRGDPGPKCTNVDGNSDMSIELKCNYLEWIDPEWSEAMKLCLTELWSMYKKENKDRLRDNVQYAEEDFKVIGEKRKMEEELRFFKLDFAKMVADKEEAITPLGNARLALSDLKEEMEKKKLADHGCTNLHQILRAKAEKERDQLVLERDQVVTERDQLKQEKKKLEYMIADLLKQKHGYKDKVKKLKEICAEF